MSIRVMTDIWDSGMYDGGTLLVLLALADWAGDDGGRIYPGMEKLASKTRMSVRNVQYAIAKLVKDETLVAVEHAQGGRGHVTHYRIDLERVKKLHPSEDKGCKIEQERVQNPTLKGAKSDIPPIPPYIDNHQEEPLREPLKRAARGKSKSSEASLFKEQPETIPNWIPAESWNAFVEMRKKGRAPLTAGAVRLIIKKLSDLTFVGDDPGAVLDQSTMNGWKGVFPLRQNGASGNGHGRRNGRGDAIEAVNDILADLRAAEGNRRANPEASGAIASLFSVHAIAGRTQD